MDSRKHPTSGDVVLVWLGSGLSPPRWPLGRVFSTAATPRAVHDCVAKGLAETEAEAWLFWDSSLGPPDPEVVERTLARPGDVWHAGLRLGMGGLPGIIDFARGTWMLNCDPEATIEATSWRLSLRACLIRTDVLHQMGDVHPEFRSLEGAALEMGHRYVARGVLARHIPWLVPENPAVMSRSHPIQDELRFLYYRFGRKWAIWGLTRAVMKGYAAPIKALSSWHTVMSQPCPVEPKPYQHVADKKDDDVTNARVTVLVPTIDRYPYLRTLLSQLRSQTVKPLEIIIVDQTPLARRDPCITDEFHSLPLLVIYQDEPGQCSSRNAGLQVVQGDYVLFLDDDDEVAPALIEDHLRTLNRFRADVSSGVADEVGAGPLPDNFKYIRASDVFPTNNTLIHKNVLRRSGLFDLAYNRGQRADGDLGMRVYRSGAVMVLNPEISVLHHHAPQGGLRTHRARVITYASSRQRLTHRHLPSATEIYLARRYFTAVQVREASCQRLVGTFSASGSVWHRAMKCLVSLLCLPNSVYQLQRTAREARAMQRVFPDIPILDDGHVRSTAEETS